MKTQIKLFSSANLSNIENAVNEFLKTVDVRDIKLSSCDDGFDIMVIYRTE